MHPAGALGVSVANQRAVLLLKPSKPFPAASVTPKGLGAAPAHPHSACEMQQRQIPTSHCTFHLPLTRDPGPAKGRDPPLPPAAPTLGACCPTGTWGPRRDFMAKRMICLFTKMNSSTNTWARQETDRKPGRAGTLAWEPPPPLKAGAPPCTNRETETKDPHMAQDPQGEAPDHSRGRRHPQPSPARCLHHPPLQGLP